MLYSHQLENNEIVMRNILLVGLGGAVGAMLRYGVTLLCNALNWSSNLGTFLVNIAGSFAMGLLVSCCGQSPWLLMATVGICGGFTTFSSFALETNQLMAKGQIATSVCYVTLSVLFGVLAVFAA